VRKEIVINKKKMIWQWILLISIALIVTCIVLKPTIWKNFINNGYNSSTRLDEPSDELVVSELRVQAAAAQQQQIQAQQDRPPRQLPSQKSGGMVVVGVKSDSLNGRLGNNLCQVIMAAIVAKQCNLKVGLVASEINSPSLMKRLLKFQDRFAMANTMDFTQSSTIKEGRQYWQKIAIESQLETDAAEKGVILNGYWQHADYYWAHRDDIRELLNPYGPSSIVKNKCAIHVRKGDYVYMGWDLPESYYVNALTFLRSRFPKLKYIIFSDDAKYAEDAQKRWGDDTETYSHFCQRRQVTELQDPFDLILFMSLFEHHIISSSSFSWWAAFLCPESKSIQHVAIAPKPWFTNRPADGFIDCPLFTSISR
jgi:Glycosyl transferase family 11